MSEAENGKKSVQEIIAEVQATEDAEAQAIFDTCVADLTKRGYTIAFEFRQRSHGQADYELYLVRKTVRAVPSKS